MGVLYGGFIRYYYISLNRADSTRLDLTCKIQIYIETPSKTQTEKKGGGEKLTEKKGEGELMMMMMMFRNGMELM